MLVANYKRLEQRLASQRSAAHDSPMCFRSVCALRASRSLVNKESEEEK